MHPLTPIGCRNSGLAAQARFAMGLSIDEPLAQLRSGATHFYSADGLGSVTSLTTGAGAIAASYTYDTFGNLAASSGSIVNPFRYTAREWDAEAGLYFYRARYYGPSAGRFLSEDPLQFVEGLNFFRYVENDPLNRVDPFGLATCTYSITAGTLKCIPDDPRNAPVDIRVASGNNGEGLQCKNNPNCTDKPNRGPIPQGWWEWTSGYTRTKNGRVLKPLPGTNTHGRTALRTHSCASPFGPALGPKYCSEGCVTGTPEDIKKLNRLVDAEPGSRLHVVN